MSPLHRLTSPQLWIEHYRRRPERCRWARRAISAAAPWKNPHKYLGNMSSLLCLRKFDFWMCTKTSEGKFRCECERTCVQSTMPNQSLRILIDSKAICRHCCLGGSLGVTDYTDYIIVDNWKYSYSAKKSKITICKFSTNFYASCIYSINYLEFTQQWRPVAFVSMRIIFNRPAHHHSGGTLHFQGLTNFEVVLDNFE